MGRGQTIFAQLMEFLPVYEFNKCVSRYNGNRGIRSFSCFDQFLCMAFAQLTHRESLRDLETCFRVAEKRLYHSGFRGRMSRSTLADANETRDWRIYRDFAQILISRARFLHSNEEWGVDLKSTAYALDSTTIDLCLELFSWAKFKPTKAAIKVHTLLDLRGNIPGFISITNGRSHDVYFLDDISFEAGAYYIMDRGYFDSVRLKRIDAQGAYFVTRDKLGIYFDEVTSHPVQKKSGVTSDKTIVFTGNRSQCGYPDELRRVTFYDKAKKRELNFLTNNFRLASTTIAELYKSRWQIELFFKWIKQHLRIKAFYGNSENAVKTQLWIAISVYVLVAIVRQELQVKRSLYEILQILDVMIFEKTPINAVFERNMPRNLKFESSNLATLFGD